MEELWIEPKMIDFGNKEVNKIQKPVNKKLDQNYKKDVDGLGDDREN